MTAELVLNQSNMAVITRNLEEWPPRDCQIYLSFLPYEPRTRFERRTEELIGNWKHVEISFDVHGPVGPVAFSAWSGHFEPLPDDAGLLSRAWRWVESYVRTPPIMRGAFVAPRTFSNEKYTHLAFNVTSDEEAALFHACMGLHGAGFNAMGYYRSVLPPSFQRTTDRSAFFCSEAVLTALQDANILPSIVDEEAIWLADANPGGIIPDRLYTVLRPYGSQVFNQVHSINHSVGAGRRPTFFAASEDLSEI